MSNVAAVIFSELINLYSKENVNPSREQRCLAFMLCKNLADLCETGRAILDQVETRIEMKTGEDLPDRTKLEEFQLIMKEFYREDMFDEEGNPNWKVVEKFPKDRSAVSFKFYCIIKRNVMGKKGGEQIIEAIEKKDKEYFLKNFESIFTDLPDMLKEGLSRFKNFISSKNVQEDERDIVWGFFQGILDIFVNEKTHIENLLSS